MLSKLFALIKGKQKQKRRTFIVTEDDKCTTAQGLSCSAHIKDLNQLQTSFRDNYDSDRHTIVCSATGSGKTVVAYIAGSAYLSTGQRIIMLAPTKELTNELHTKMASVFGANLVGRYTGGDKNDKDIEQKFVIIATPEAYLSAYRSEREWSLTAKLLIVDEAHNIIDPGRGGSLDVAMAVFRENGGKLLLMSGTFPNAQEIGEMLDADMFISDFTITKLIKHTVFCPDDIDAQSETAMATTGKGGLTVARQKRPSKSDLPEGVRMTASGYVYNARSARIRMLTEMIEQFAGESVIIFVPSKAIGYCLSEHLGIPFHCADIDDDEKTRIVQEFNGGTIKKILATSTLAQGVNTPADKVIICGTSSSKYGHYIDSATIRQMLGRAGRNKAEAHVYVMGNELELFHAEKDAYGKTLALPTETMLMTQMANRQTTMQGLLKSLSLTFAATLVKKAKLMEAIETTLRKLRAFDLIKETKSTLTLTQEGTLLARYFIDPTIYIGYKNLATKLLHIPDTAISREYKGCLLMAHVIDRLPKHRPPMQYEKDLSMMMADNNLKADFKDIRIPKVATILDFSRNAITVPPYFGSILHNSVDRWIGMLNDMEKYEVHEESPGKAVMQPILSTLRKASIEAKYKAEARKARDAKRKTITRKEPDTETTNVLPFPNAQRGAECKNTPRSA